MDTTSLIIPAFIAGVLTFLAPCTLPLVPGYLAFISGVNSRDLADPAKLPTIRRKVFFNGVMYVLGFSVVFISLGSVFGLAGSFLAQNRIWLARVGGLFVMFFGLYLMGIFRLKIFHFKFIGTLSQERRLNFSRLLTPGKPLSSFIFGATFAFGWTPCIGPILGTILVLASTAGTIFQGAFLLLIFSLGLALPFLIIALAVGHAAAYIGKVSRYLNIISFIGGGFLVILGYLLFTDNFILLSARFYDWFAFINYENILDYL